MRALAAQERAFYCPVIEKHHRTSTGGVRKSFVPLFTNYVFLRGEETDRYSAVCTGHVAASLAIPDPSRFLQQMQSVEQMIHCGVPLELEPQLTVGTYVRIKSGPLKGLRGHIAQLRDRARFIVNVEFLQQGTSTLIDGWELERL
jgi:transcription antitermination factor NusG